MVNPHQGSEEPTAFGLVDLADVQANRGWFIGLGIAFVVLGALSIFLPLIASLVTTIVLGWLMVLTGLSQGFHALANRRWAGSGWAIVSALLFVIAGLLVAAFPVTGTLTLTLVLSAFLVAQGILKVIRAVQHRAIPAWGWLAFDGLLSVVLGILIWAGWPSTAAWALRPARRYRSRFQRLVDAADRPRRGAGGPCDSLTPALVVLRTGSMFSPRREITMNKLTPPVGPGDHVFGNPDAPVTLVEYGDYECPYCRRAHLVVEEVLRQMGPEARFFFRHFPLAEMHPHAVAAAQAAEAAGAQGKFWPMHATLYENQAALEPEDLLGYAGSLGLDVPRFARELATDAHLAKVEADFHSGVRSGVQGTPTFFINGVRHEAGWDAPTLLAALRAASRMKNKRAA